MTNIVRDSDVVELNQPPAFTYGEKVRSRRTVRNDGTYVGKEIGELLQLGVILGFDVGFIGVEMHVNNRGAAQFESRCRRLGSRLHSRHYRGRSHYGDVCRALRRTARTAADQIIHGVVGGGNGH